MIFVSQVQFLNPQQNQTKLGLSASNKMCSLEHVESLYVLCRKVYYSSSSLRLLNENVRFLF